MVQKTLIDEVIDEKDGLRNFMRETNLLEITELLAQVMMDRVTTKAELALLLGKKEKYVEGLLFGRQKMTIQELSDILYVMDVRLKLKSGTCVEKISSDLIKRSKKAKK